jgi:hypothetical protein
MPRRQGFANDGATAADCFNLAYELRLCGQGTPAGDSERRASFQLAIAGFGSVLRTASKMLALLVPPNGHANLHRVVSGFAGGSKFNLIGPIPGPLAGLTSPSMERAG